MSEAPKFEFTVPNDEWEAVQPPPGQLFMMMRRGEFDVYRPNISVDMAPLQPDATVVDAADITPQRLANMGAGARLVGREIHRPNESTVVKQRIDFSVTRNDGSEVALTQGQYFLELLPTDRDSGDEAHGVLCFLLTCEPEDITVYGEDFNAFIQSARAVKG